MRRRDILSATALLGPTAIVARSAAAQGDWPARTVTIVVPFTPGSSSDIIARAIAQPMQQSLGKPVVVENRPGATGEIGARSVVRSAPDGYTLMHGPISTWAINVPLRPKLAYDPVKQFTRITQTVRTPNVLVVNPQKVPAGDLAGVVEWAKRNERSASYSSSGIGSSDHLTMEMFKQVTGTDIAHAPYAGGAPAVTDLIAGTVQLSFQNLGSVIPHIQEGRLKPILITSDKRSPLLPQVPTAGEAGLRDFVVYSWQALGGPAGIPAPLLERIHKEAVTALRSPETAKRLDEIGFEVVGSTPQEFAAFQEGEIARWRRVIEAGGITPD
ncbi:MAG TPA: tripartite tricarboxylate transporter substrate binding protein [Acetobacteraceae bacterium]|jgi:tripartite-type tricarboxylate transporter receptor subunit TctC|nr:tripartite tricarboxylate transporter substrate binding protein [Acetobacteraceae bacterium]